MFPQTRSARTNRAYEVGMGITFFFLRTNFFILSILPTTCWCEYTVWRLCEGCARDNLGIQRCVQDASRLPCSRQSFFNQLAYRHVVRTVSMIYSRQEQTQILQVSPSLISNGETLWERPFSVISRVRNQAVTLSSQAWPRPTGSCLQRCSRFWTVLKRFTRALLNLPKLNQLPDWYEIPSRRSIQSSDAIR